MSKKNKKKFFSACSMQNLQRELSRRFSRTNRWRQLWADDEMLAKEVLIAYAAQRGLFRRYFGWTLSNGYTVTGIISALMEASDQKRASLIASAFISNTQEKLEQRNRKAAAFCRNHVSDVAVDEVVKVLTLAPQIKKEADRHAQHAVASDVDQRVNAAKAKRKQRIFKRVQTKAINAVSRWVCAVEAAMVLNIAEPPG